MFFWESCGGLGVVPDGGSGGVGLGGAGGAMSWVEFHPLDRVNSMLQMVSNFLDVLGVVAEGGKGWFRGGGGGCRGGF